MNRACCSLQNAVPEAGFHLSHTFSVAEWFAGMRLFGCTRARIYVRVLHSRASLYV